MSTPRLVEGLRVRFAVGSLSTQHVPDHLWVALREHWIDFCTIETAGAYADKECSRVLTATVIAWDGDDLLCRHGGRLVRVPVGAVEVIDPQGPE